MEIGILTFHRALNYGAFLQAFSLRNYLERQGLQVNIVDYWPQKHVDAYSLFDFNRLRHSSLLFSMKYLISSLLKSTRFLKRRKKMEVLWKEYFKLDKSIKYRTPQSLSYLDYDYLIYGSDQIWWKWNNTPNGLFDWAYWGDFAPKSINKISYAASMGVINVNEEDKKKIAKKMENFQFISVRETQLQQLIQPLTHKEIYKVIDPVFLTDKKNWEKYAKKPKIQKKYVLLFNLMKSPEAKFVAQKKALDLQCELIEITPSIQPLKINKNVYQTLDAFEFLGFIKNAEFVVTSSFHGTAFSIIFEKQFYAIGMRNNSDRVASLLKSLKISNRLLKTNDNKESLNPINYIEVSKYLEKEINSSKKFLQKSLGSNNV